MLFGGVLLLLVGIFLVVIGISYICHPMEPPVCFPSELTATGKAGVVLIAVGFFGAVVGLVRQVRRRRGR